MRPREGLVEQQTTRSQPVGECPKEVTLQIVHTDHDVVSARGEGFALEVYGPGLDRQATLRRGKETAGPQTYRGGVQEPAESKGGAPGGMVPRDMVDEQTSGKNDEQEMGAEALGGFAREEPSVQVPRDGGDDADATRDGGPDPDSPSRTGSGSVPDPGRTGDTN